VTDLKILGLLTECRERMGISREVIPIQTDKVKATTLFGFVRPKLLLPMGIEKMLSLRDLTYIFYHELAHIKQKDILINLIAGLLQAVHWFNPVIWYGFFRMRQDREVASDALALSYIHPGEYKEYGRVIIDLLENFSRPPEFPA
jgi:bla regulator protein blaR1